MGDLNIQTIIQQFQINIQITYIHIYIDSSLSLSLGDVFCLTFCPHSVQVWPQGPGCPIKVPLWVHLAPRMAEHPRFGRGCPTPRWTQIANGPPPPHRCKPRPSRTGLESEYHVLLNLQSTTLIDSVLRTKETESHRALFFKSSRERVIGRSDLSLFVIR